LSIGVKRNGMQLEVAFVREAGYFQRVEEFNRETLIR
jgi:hypothetical protein